MNHTTPSSLLRRLFEPPYLVWILIPFAISYLLFYRIPPPFAQQTQWIHLGSWIVPALSQPGWDLFVYRASPLPYPPLNYLLFWPLAQLDLMLAYKILSCITLVAAVIASFVFPLVMTRERRISAVLVLMLASALFSSGMQLEFDRGQFNMIAVLLAWAAIWIFHRHPGYRFVAYIFFCLSVQLKLWPLIFMLLLIRDWRDWKANLKRMALLTIANFALLFVMGPSIFVEFVNLLTVRTADPARMVFTFPINSSIHSFVIHTSSVAATHGLRMPDRYYMLAESCLLGVVAACLLLLMLRLYQRRSRDLDPYLLLACAITAILLPTISFDYKLPMLAAPLALVFSAPAQPQGSGSGRLWLTIVLTFIISLAYSSTLFSVVNKVPLFTSISPFAVGFFVNNFAPLFIMLLAVTALAFTSQPPADAGHSAA